MKKLLFFLLSCAGLHAVQFELSVANHAGGSAGNRVVVDLTVCLIGKEVSACGVVRLQLEEGQQGIYDLTAACACQGEQDCQDGMVQMIEERTGPVERVIVQSIRLQAMTQVESNSAIFKKFLYGKTTTVKLDRDIHDFDGKMLEIIHDPRDEHAYTCRVVDFKE